MLIDINAFTGHWPFMQLQYNTCDALGQRMDKFGTDVSLISNLNGIFYKNTQPANEELYHAIRASRRYKDRFIPLAVINPTYAGWQRDLKTSVSKYGMRGVRVYPRYHDYEVTDPRLIQLVKMCGDMGLPVFFVNRMVDSRQRSWMDLDYVPYTPKPEWTLKNFIPVLEAVPEAKYVISNICNGFSLSSNERKVFNNANVLMDTSGRSLVNFAQMMKTYGSDRFAFGTHSPILDYVTGLLRIESLRKDEADEDTKERIRSGNARKFFGI